MSLFRKRSRSRSLTGVYMDARSLAVATVEHDSGRKPRLAQADWQQIPAEQDLARLLRVSAPSARNPVNLVLANDHYQLLLVEAPRVEASELRAAVRWKIKNLIDFDIADAVIDVFEIPGQQSRPHNQALMYTIAARAREIRELIDLFENADLDLRVIDVVEMALRNLAIQLEDDERGVAILYLDKDHGIIALNRQGSLYLNRRVDVGVDSLAADSEGAIDQILQEIQRSLDYYDSHFSQPPLASLQVLPGFDGHRQLIETLDTSLEMAVQGYAIDQAIDCTDARLDDSTPAALLLAIGGALRREEASP